MTPRRIVSVAFVGGVDPAWKIGGVADFNGDGQLDLVWRNSATGRRTSGT
jgi:hypothetical protein